MLGSQEELEKFMVDEGYHRSHARMKDDEERGAADRSPYARPVYQAFIEPLALLIKEAKETKGARAMKAHVTLLQDMDPLTVAVVAVRTALGYMMEGGEDPTIRKLAHRIGRMVHAECYLSQFRDLAPDLYHELSQELGRRRSQDTQHRIAYYSNSIKNSGLELDKWTVSNQHQIGMFIASQLESLGMITIDTSREQQWRGKGDVVGVWLDPELMKFIGDTKEKYALARPSHLPCIEPPRDWVSFSEGGFHTDGMRRTHPFLAKVPATAREALRGHKMPQVYQGINQLQKTRWRVNTAVLDVLNTVGRMRDFGDVQLIREEQRPPPPDWLKPDAKPEDLEGEWAVKFKDWKQTVAVWHTQNKLRRSKQTRFFSMVKAGNIFRDVESLYFVWFADSRGRLYPLAQGLNPQGSDSQRGSLMFAEGKAITSERGQFWFLVNGANLWGFDKAPLEERAVWHAANQELILAVARDPVNNQGWIQADSPAQFLAWCFEYAKWVDDPDNFLTYLPVYLDGSCNGLQHFSAMLRDEVGGKATNLTHTATKQDVYQEVADKVLSLMKAVPPSPITVKWVEHGIPRAAIKRPVMTTPYGVTKGTATKNIRKDYLVPGHAPVFSHGEYLEASQVLVQYTWAAIGEVVVKSREAMDWLHEAGKQVAVGADPDSCMVWDTPSGFLASQAYFTMKATKVNTVMYGFLRLNLHLETPDLAPGKNGTALPPNFLHSMDASHLVMTVNEFLAMPGRSLCTVHDAYGTHASDTEELFHAIRKTFVDMYEKHDPLEDFRQRHKIEAPLPKRGTLDLAEVKNSEFFFS